ncbi:hypothetical protein CDAR_622091 [Caerostris darwini]|uniref:Uncharacterized protein n=1 Tax=Caerostris darwini TaxID=1538125 RepID=A0AAV4RYY4_9ARAC|nr:hypothetical protein CDAR_7481 [Caerostris darwini]GIY25914.1 hypothetical protein CDAR_622091 [Caerostris darwini]
MLNSFDEWETRPIIPSLNLQNNLFPGNISFNALGTADPGMTLSPVSPEPAKGGRMQSGTCMPKSTKARFDKDHSTGRILNGVASHVKALALFLHARSPPRMGLIGKFLLHNVPTGHPRVIRVAVSDESADWAGSVLFRAVRRGSEPR